LRYIRSSKKKPGQAVPVFFTPVQGHVMPKIGLAELKKPGSGLANHHAVENDDLQDLTLVRKCAPCPRE
jgi:hypothetical protein